MDLEEIVNSKNMNDSMSLFVFDVKKTPQNDFKIIEVSNSKTFISPKMNETLSQYLLSEEINPHKKPVRVIRDKNIHPAYLSKGVENIIGKNTMQQETLPQNAYQPRFEDYSQIILDTSNESPQVFPVPQDAFHINNEFFHDISSNKLHSSYLLDTFSPLTKSIDSKKLESLSVFEGKDVIAKSVTGFTSLGIRYIPHFTFEKLQSLLEEFELTKQEKNQLGNDYHPLLEELFIPDMIQEFVGDNPLYSLRTNTYHTSVDRVATLVTSNSGRISQYYIGGFHRFRSNETSKLTPICLRNKHSFMEEFSQEHEENIINFTKKAFTTYYKNILENSSH